MSAVLLKPSFDHRIGRSGAWALLIGLQFWFAPAALAGGWTANRWSVSTAGSMTMPSVSVDQSVAGRLIIVIPAGMNAEMLQNGMNDYGLPEVIRLRVGDVVSIENRDVVPHAILYAVVDPGQIDVRTITKAGSEIYSAGCGASAGASGFTSIFISNR